MAMSEMVPIGVGAGFLGAAVSASALSVVAGLASFSGVIDGSGGGRHMMQPIRHFSRNSR